MHIYAHEELNNSPLTQTNTILTPHSDLSIMGSTMLPKTPIDKKQLSKQASNEQPQTQYSLIPNCANIMPKTLRLQSKHQSCTMNFKKVP
jgi:hypothetical protein